MARFFKMLFFIIGLSTQEKKIRRVERQVVILYLCELRGEGAEGFDSDLMREVVAISDALSWPGW